MSKLLYNKNMPQIDINLKRGQNDARKDLVDFWRDENPLSNLSNTLTPITVEEENRWGFKPDIENDVIIPIGKDGKGFTLFDFNQGYNLIAGGGMLSGAGMFKRVSLLHILKNYSPEKVKVILLDTTNQMEGFDKSNHLLFPRATKIDDFIKLLDWCQKESERRCDILEKNERPWISSYNKYKKDNEEFIPSIFIFISELGDILSEENGLNSVMKVAQLTRATSIHFIITTQRPSSETVSDLIKANFLNRIAFKMPYKEESELFIDQVGAEELLGQGDMLFKDSNDKIHHLQGLFFLEDDIEAVSKIITHSL